MTAGRRPKPTQLKLITGNPGKRKLNENEPQPEAASSEAPEVLGAVGKTEWSRVFPILEKCRMISALDVAALTAYCRAYERWREAEQNVEKQGAVFLTKDGYPIQNPYLHVANRAMEQMLRFLVEMGMTPSSRSRVSAMKAPPAGNPFSSLPGG